MNKGESPFISKSSILATVYTGKPSWFGGLRTSPPGQASQKQAVTCAFHLEHSVKETFKDPLSYFPAVGTHSGPSESC